MKRNLKKEGPYYEIANLFKAIKHVETDLITGRISLANDIFHFRKNLDEIVRLYPVVKTYSLHRGQVVCRFLAFSYIKFKRMAGANNAYAQEAVDKLSIFFEHSIYSD